MNNDTAAFVTPVQEDFPYRVTRRVDTVVVRDGTPLSIGLWLPEGLPDSTTGVVLEAVPYRKDDVSLIDDETRFGYLAGNGIACARLDLRGSGSSGGVLTDEYTPGEQADLVDVVNWLAVQPWCNGSVGMIGISWSGFNALQVAAQRPEPLKAIVTVCSSDDRYDNDVHYLGGIPLAFYLNLWGTALHMMGMRPPMPSVIGPDWLSEWDTRLRTNPDFTSLWLSHPHRDAYWRQGSVCEDYDAIECPVLLVGGWADNYTDTVFRLLDRLPGVAQAIVGPWGHTWPERPEPGPGIDFLGRCLRWWQHWLNGVDNGVPDDPRCTVYLQDYVFSREDLDQRPGQWLAVDEPGAVVEQRPFGLGAHGVLGERAAGGATATVPSDQVVGMQGRHLLPMGVSTDLPGLQDADDAGSLLFDSGELREPVSILGQVLLRLRMASDAPTGHLFVRLNDVDPDGHSHLVARGALNLTHRRGHAPEQVAPLEPGVYEIYELALKHTAYRFARGHRIRLALSSTYWPWLWPAPDHGTVTVELSGSQATLPVLGGSSLTDLPIDLGSPVIAPAPLVEVERTSEPYWTSEREADGWIRVRRGSRGVDRLMLPDGWTVENLADDTVYALREGDPLTASMQRRLAQAFHWTDRHAVIEFTSSMTCDRDNFYVTNDAEITLDGRLHFGEHTVNTVPRGL